MNQPAPGYPPGQRQWQQPAPPPGYPRGPVPRQAPQSPPGPQWPQPPAGPAAPPPWPQGPDPKPRHNSRFSWLRPRKRGFWHTLGWALLMIVLLPFLALWAMWLVFTFILTPVAFAVHLALWPLGCAWAGLCYVCGARPDTSGRMFRPVPPRFPPFWTLSYWLRLRTHISEIFEFFAELFN